MPVLALKRRNAYLMQAVNREHDKIDKQLITIFFSETVRGVG